MKPKTEETKANWFRWGLLLAWVPFLVVIGPSIFGLLVALRAAHVTGLAAVAGGTAEGLFTFGLVAAIVCEIAAVFLIIRTFSPARPLRTLFSILTLFGSGLMLTAMGLFVWSVPLLRRH